MHTMADSKKSKTFLYKKGAQNDLTFSSLEPILPSHYYAKTNTLRIALANTFVWLTLDSTLEVPGMTFISVAVLMLSLEYTNKYTHAHTYSCLCT